jgi:GNAT superfamily N-acetyltransferase
MSDRVVISLWEPLALLRDDGLEDLIVAHHAEVGLHKEVMPLAVDWEQYHKLETLGMLKLAAARAGEALVGYASWLWLPHLHYAETIHASNDAVYMRPEWRGAGVRLMRECEQRLTADAVPKPVRILYHIKLDVEAARGTIGRVLERRGFKAFETCYDRIAIAQE